MAWHDVTMAQKKGGQRQSGNPAKRSSGGGSSVPAVAPPSSLRQRFERVSAPLILSLARLPRWVFPLAMAALLVAGLMVNPGGLGGLFLLVLVAALCWLTALSWPALTVAGRILRVITILAALAVVYARFTGRM